MESLYDSLGPSLTTRCLAWSVGNISSSELFIDIKEECEKNGINWISPTEEL